MPPDSQPRNDAPPAARLVRSPSAELQLAEGQAPAAPAKHPLVRPFHVADDWIARGETALLVLMVATMVVLGFTHVALRKFGGGIDWADIVLRHLVLWTGLLGATAATRAGRHLNMDALTRVLPQGVRRAAAVTTNLFACTICVWLAQVSVAFVAETRQYADRPIFLGVFEWQQHLVFIVAFALMAYRFLLAAADFAFGAPLPEEVHG